jgi:hypothetical protein
MKTIALALALLTATAATPTSAATFARSGDTLAISGSIGEGDSVVFRIQLIDSVRVIALDSTGGYVDESLAIGRAIRERHLDTVVPVGASCVSACSLVWAAGRRRVVNGHLGMHCAVTLAAPEQCDPAARAGMVAFLQEMDAPPVLVEYQQAAGSTYPIYVEREKLLVADGVDLDEPPPPPPPPRQPRLPGQYYGPPPGFIELPGGRIAPCILPLITAGLLRACI